MESLKAIESLNTIISQIKFYQLRINFEALEVIRLSEYKGSAFRGCFGDALRHEVCRYPNKNCESCHLQQECLFALLFESPLPRIHHLFGKYTHPPRPYLIIPMPGKQTTIEVGEIFYFDLILVGSAIRFLPKLIRVFQGMGELGMGINFSKFIAKSIEQYSPQTGYQPLPVIGQPPEITLHLLPYHPIESTVILEFQHPVRFLKDRKPYKIPPPFGLLVDNLARRMALLAHLYCNADWVETDRVFKADDEVKIKSQYLEWKDWTRYSGTQKKKMFFDGHLGRITYEGELSSWSKLVNLGVWLHAGSTATFGLGKYQIVPNE